MEIQSLAIPAVKLITPRKFGDHRGFFSETYNAKAFSEAGLDITFVQDNHSLSATTGTLRGLHFQTNPHPQAKLVRVVRGSIYDVAVDIRHGSPTFGQWVGAELSAENWQQLLIPEGFAHGFCTLEPDTEVVYKVSGLYAPETDRGIAWDDPDLAIDWPLDRSTVVLSEKDTKHPTLADSPTYFTYEQDA
jgi:dTDP-4-dehydrorhamnose 3,5-epimerase